MKNLLIIDGNNLAYRSYYALPFLTNRKGSPTGAVYGFANILTRFITEHKPDYIAVCFDPAGGDDHRTFRHDLYADYKGTRKEPMPELIMQFPEIERMLKAMGIKVFQSPNNEADDLIGSISKCCDVKTVILSGDKDLLQLVDNKTDVWLTKKGITELLKVDESNIKSEFGVSAPGIIELKSLMGDSSDNIPGIPGIGEKTALNLLDQFGDLDNLYKNTDKLTGRLKEKVENGKEMAYLSKQLATIKLDCDIKFNIEECTYPFPFSRQVRDFFDEQGFNSLLKKAELFSSTITESYKDGKFVERIAFTKEILKNIQKEVKNTLCFDINNLEFFVGGKVYFLQATIDLFSEAISEEDVFATFCEALESENVLKISNNIKKAMHMLDRMNIKLGGRVFDVSLANYLISPVKLNIEVDGFEELRDSLISEMKTLGLDDIFEDIESPLTSVLFEMEKNGIKLEKKELDAQKIKNEAELSDLTKLIHTMAGESFNINSPKQMSEILFDKLGIDSWNNRKKSTGRDVLYDIKDKHPIVPLIMKFRKIQKLVSTYIDVYQDAIKNDGAIIHTTFEQMVTSTGRLSSTNPNLQNIPIRNEEGREVRKVFVSKFDGGTLITFDYNQIELRLLAHLSGDENLIQAYNDGRDIHTETAMSIFHLNREDVTSNLRRTAKAVNFGIVYGISDYGLSQNVGSTVAEAKEYIENYFNKYPKVRSYMDGNISFAKEKGYVSTIWGRRRNIPEIHSSNYNLRQFGERVAMNMPLQGSASDIIKLAMVNVQKKLKEANFKSQLVLQVHDELVIDAYPGESDSVTHLVQKEMEKVAKLKVKLPVSIGEGKNLYECE